MSTHNERVMLRSGHGEVALDELRVVKTCSRCYPGGEQVPDIEPRLVSPSGVVHESTGYGVTDCGHDATGDGWWWAL